MWTMPLNILQGLDNIEKIGNMKQLLYKFQSKMTCFRILRLDDILSQKVIQKFHACIFRTMFHACFRDKCRTSYIPRRLDNNIQ